MNMHDYPADLIDITDSAVAGEGVIIYKVLFCPRVLSEEERNAVYNKLKADLRFNPRNAQTDENGRVYKWEGEPIKE